MPANNFEDDVRKKMEELRFVPSADVWTQVEEKIREDRKRRRFFFWLPLTGLLIGGLLWFVWPAQTTKTSARLQTPANGVTAKAAETANAAGNGAASSPSARNAGENPDSTLTVPATPNSKTDNGSNAPVPAPPHSETVNGSSAPVPGSGTKKSSNKSSVGDESPSLITTEEQYLASVSRGAEKGKNPAGAKSGRAVKNNHSRTGGLNKLSSETATTGEIKNADRSKEESIVPAAVETETDKSADGKTKAPTGADWSATDSSTVSGDSKKTASNALTGEGNDSATSGKQTAKKATDSAGIAKANSGQAKSAAKKAPSKKNKIEWGFTASGGFSRQLEKNDIPTDVLSRAFANSSVYVINKSELNAGLAFSAGLVAAKQIGKTWRLQSGVQVAHASATLPNAGQRGVYGAASVPSSNTNYLVSAAYAPGTGNGNASSLYTNRYTFIQIPVILEKQLGLRSPISLQAGVSAAYLSGVHALIYQPLLDQYVEDNSKFNKLQFSGLFGVYWKFDLDKHWALRAGPELQYQFTNLMKSAAPVNDRLVTAALRVIIMHRSTK